MKILAIGAHIDDPDFGCAGTLYKMAQKGHEVSYLALSDCDNPLLLKEVQLSSAILGVKLLELFTFQRRVFSLHRQDILDILIKYCDKIQPDIVFTHGSNDGHQDHQVVYNESLRAFKDQSVFGYNFPWNQFHEPCKSLVTVKIDIEKKIEALSKYESQKHRGYFNPEFIRAWNYSGETFEIIRLNEKMLCAG